ncbi:MULTISPECIES: SLC13 family permease [Virgibacillus]|uniref:Sodium-dependent dicarboxylate transporter SdcS n=1 Tax=Virgibacillus pantothenticus TaxID=1473 RepID=A0A0L0QNA5_VIRPA|nr:MULTISPECIES: DASS family sodium-coupled anion symporter [Virgibacillus]API93421.1 anion transporter [Virgibacillus sp. 6R]KNE19738.1 anion transporter [Virgibacillus pantothenticus]MBS7430210.1 DASS family sodium-coupled anion symporter [Virgibacillus sp. 19R1-5]MED3735750.1 DASS family sodium-coupled anion symporter [Virgibacillus pantothenticus]QTY14725.1 DASS family sodium-coupled anion symporter [Virgibacillus pantothenticus]
MFSSTWNWMWEKHDEIKSMFTFFVRANTSRLSTSRSIDPSDTLAGKNHDYRGNRNYKPGQIIGLIAGPLLFAITLLFFSPEGLSQEGLAVLASTIWIAIWWMTEAIPIPATSLLPIILFPLTGGLDIGTTTSSYGSDTIFLFMGGFMIALAMEKWNLHRRIALSIISVIGTNTNRIILGFMVSTGFLSMWISNTATAMMMVPIGLAIIYQISEALKGNPSIDTSKENFAFGKALMLGIAYSASVGGIATLIGTPPNAALAGVINKMYGIELSFAKWMLFGVPIAWVFILIIWFYLIKVAYPLKLKELPGGKAVIHQEIQKLGKSSAEEKAVFTVFVLTACAWISRSFFLVHINPNINDAIIAMCAAVILFLLPSKNHKDTFLLDWNTAVKLPWGILLLFGGGLAIAAGFTQSGLSEWIGNQLTALQGIHIFIVLLAVTGLVIFLTEITSNTATANMMYPIMAALAIALGVHPFVVMIAAGVASSCAFMLPVATPPNAVVFGSGYLRIQDMAKSGFALNIIGTILVTLAIYFLLPIFWGININEVPNFVK